MKIASYTIEANARSLTPFTHFKIHNRGRVNHLVWWKLSVLYGPTQHCEECGVQTGLEQMCDACYEHHFCECGTRLCDSAGSPGDGLCRRCD